MQRGCHDQHQCPLELLPPQQRVVSSIASSRSRKAPGICANASLPSSLPPEHSGVCCVTGGRGREGSPHPHWRGQFCWAACSPLGAHPVTLALACHEISEISVKCLLNVGTWLSLHLELAAERGAPSLSTLICTASPLQNGPILSVRGSAIGHKETVTSGVSWKSGSWSSSQQAWPDTPGPHPGAASLPATCHTPSKLQLPEGSLKPVPTSPPPPAPSTAARRLGGTQL